MRVCRPIWRWHRAQRLVPVVFVILRHVKSLCCICFLQISVFLKVSLCMCVMRITEFHFRSSVRLSWIVMYAVLLSHKIVNVDIKCMKRGKCELVNVNETVLYACACAYVCACVCVCARKWCACACPCIRERSHFLIYMHRHQLEATIRGTWKQLERPIGAISSRVFTREYSRIAFVEHCIGGLHQFIWFFIHRFQLSLCAHDHVSITHWKRELLAFLSSRDWACVPYIFFKGSFFIY